MAKEHGAEDKIMKKLTLEVNREEAERLVNALESHYLAMKKWQTSEDMDARIEAEIEEKLTLELQQSLISQIKALRNNL